MIAAVNKNKSKKKRLKIQNFNSQRLLSIEKNIKLAENETYLDKTSIFLCEHSSMRIYEKNVQVHRNRKINLNCCDDNTTASINAKKH